MTEEERIQAVEEQATASLLWSMDAPEAILRLLLGETGIQRLYAPPEGFNKDEQGDWDEELLTFGPRRPIKLKEEERTRDSLRVVYDFYDFGELGWWELVIEPERVTIERYKAPGGSHPAA